MKFVPIPAAVAVSLIALVPCSPAQAAGCVKGAVVGGAAGHVAGHHTALGAAAGCAVGHHEASKHAKESGAQNQPANNAGATQTSRQQ